MKSTKAVQLGLGLSLVTMLVTSGPVLAEGDITPLSEPGKGSTSWKIMRHVERGVVELVTGNDGGTLSTLCTDDACGVFVEPTSGCVPGANYPVLNQFIQACWGRADSLRNDSGRISRIGRPLCGDVP